MMKATKELDSFVPNCVLSWGYLFLNWLEVIHFNTVEEAYSKELQRL